jgi:hypothetical protein
MGMQMSVYIAIVFIDRSTAVFKSGFQMEPTQFGLINPVSRHKAPDRQNLVSETWVFK